ncbi:alanine racemase [Ruminococcaceae bacterium OttesenSCG-928-I18]|nr:alanine racemase [Ruminococcaceae bacterium OttesenSCG-928-I18]
MKKEPMLTIDAKVIRQNIQILGDIAEKQGVKMAAVVKGFHNIDGITDVFIEAGLRQIASSRLSHLEQVKKRHPGAETMALRIPMLSEVEMLVRSADISLHSERETLRVLNREAKRQHKTHRVILMRDVGDLREGMIDYQMFIETAKWVEKELDSLELYGTGANFTCYGSVIPTPKNLSELLSETRLIEKEIGRDLEVVSGGSTSSLPLLIHGGLPQGVNHLRVGEAFLVPYEVLNYWGCPVQGLSNEALTLSAEIIEIGEKPTHPIGIQGADGFGNFRRYEDKGTRRRALLALGVLDVGDLNKLLPRDKGVKILGGSSDHLIVDIQDSQRQYHLGDCLEFGLRYTSMLFSTGCPYIAKTME